MKDKIVTAYKMGRSGASGLKARESVKHLVKVTKDSYYLEGVALCGSPLGANSDGWHECASEPTCKFCITKFNNQYK